jgi:hypothetical protein
MRNPAQKPYYRFHYLEIPIGSCPFKRRLLLRGGLGDVRTIRGGVSAADIRRGDFSALDIDSPWRGRLVLASGWRFSLLFRHSSIRLGIQYATIPS